MHDKGVYRVLYLNVVKECTTAAKAVSLVYANDTSASTAAPPLLPVACH
ncbi:hypothetical protein AB1K84_17275 [Mesobacillus foraminis]